MNYLVITKTGKFTVEAAHFTTTGDRTTFWETTASRANAVAEFPSKGTIILNMKYADIQIPG